MTTPCQCCAARNIECIRLGGDPYRTPPPVGPQRYIRVGDSVFDLEDIVYIVCLDKAGGGGEIFHVYSRTQGKLAADFHRKAGDKLTAAWEAYHGQA